MIKNIFTSWKTSLVGLVIICGLGYKAFTVGFSISDALLGLVAAGFLKAKDKKISVFSRKIDQPNPDHEEK